MTERTCGNCSLLASKDLSLRKRNKRLATRKCRCRNCRNQIFWNENKFSSLNHLSNRLKKGDRNAKLQKEKLQEQQLLQFG